MKPIMTVRCLLRFRLRSLLVAIAFLGLLLTVVLQTVRLQRAASREARLRAQLLQERARAESNLQKARTAVDQLYTQIAEQQAQQAPSAAEPRRELLERTLKFYQGMETKAESPEARTRALQRARQIRSQLGNEADEGKSWLPPDPRVRCGLDVVGDPS